MAASLDDQMAALDSALAGAGPSPADGNPGTVQCQVCGTTIDTASGEPVGGTPPPSAPLAPPPLPM